MIVGIAGPTGSGKTTVAKMVADAHDAFRIKYSDILIEEAQKEGLAITKQNLQHISTRLRSEHGEDFLAEEVTRRVAVHPAHYVVVEGNRRIVDITALSNMAEARNDTLLLLFVDATVEARFARYQKREHANALSFAEFMELEQDECENEIQALRDYFKQHGTYIDTTDMTLEMVQERISDI